MRRVAFGLVPLAIAACPAAPPPKPPPLAAVVDAAAPDSGPAAPVEIALPTGVVVTPDAAPGSRILPLDPHAIDADFRASGSTSIALSPDGKTLALLTSGFNKRFAWRPAGSKGAGPDNLPVRIADEYVFLWDAATLREKRVVRVPNTFVGIAFAPDGKSLWVSGGPDDTVVSVDVETGAFAPPISLGHRDPKGLGGRGVRVGPLAAGLAVDASRLVVANHENDSLSVVDLASNAKKDVPLWPGGGKPGGGFPFAVALSGDRAFVGSQRDREVVMVDLARMKVARRVEVGSMPTRLVLDRARARLFVANAGSDSISILEIETGKLRAIDVGVLAGVKGTSPNDLALSPDEKTLYVSLGGLDAIGVVSLDAEKMIGLVPTGAYPSAIATDGARLFVGFGKGPSPPNPGGPFTDVERALVEPYESQTADQFALQLMQGGMHVFPIPDATTLARLTARVEKNRGLASTPATAPIFDALRGKVKHVLYVIGENRTYDQIFGDLPQSDADPHLLHWGRAYTPNHHAMAERSVIFDAYYAAGGVSGDGWQWTVGGRATDVAEKHVPLEYAERGKLTYDWEGLNRRLNVGLATSEERRAWNPKSPADPDILPGARDYAAPEGGFIWDAAIAAGVSVRNYGCFIDDSRYGLPKSDPVQIPTLHDPFATKTRVAYPDSPPLMDRTDPYFRGYDLKVADYWRIEEWMREMDLFEKKGEMPALELVRLAHDHVGAFDRAEDGVDTPDTQIADQDYAVGLLIERLARSPFWESTVVVVLEDDAQNGADHVSAQRSFVLFAGGHVRTGGDVVHTRYSTPSALRTIELLLGMGPVAITDAFAPPIAEAFSLDVSPHDFTAAIPPVLRSTKLPLPPGDVMQPRGTAAEWATAMEGMEFDHEDELPTEAFNAALYCGLIERTSCAARSSVAER